MIGQKKILHRREFSCYVSVCVSRNAKVLRLLPLGLPDMTASRVPPQPRIIHHKAAAMVEVNVTLQLTVSAGPATTYFAASH